MIRVCVCVCVCPCAVLRMQVKIAFDSATYRPGAEANIHFSAAAGSTLAYSAVDKSLHILGGQNQITLGRVSVD